MTQPHYEPNSAVPEGYDQPAGPEGYGPPAPPRPSQSQYPQSAQPAHRQAPAQPYQGQQPPQQGSAAPSYAPPAPYGYQGPPAYQQAPHPYQGMSHQPPAPNHAYYGYAQPKSRVVAGLLGIFLGGLGVHRFYLGFTKIAVIQLCLTLVLGVFTFGLVGLWGVIEGIMIIAGSAHFRTDAQGIPLRD